MGRRLYQDRAWLVLNPQAGMAGGAIGGRAVNRPETIALHARAKAGLHRRKAQNCLDTANRMLALSRDHTDKAEEQERIANEAESK